MEACRSAGRPIREKALPNSVDLAFPASAPVLIPNLERAIAIHGATAEASQIGACAGAGVGRRDKCARRPASRGSYRPHDQEHRRDRWQ
jgi:hypothetical protein